MSIGDPSFNSTHTLNVEGMSFWNNLTLNANQFRQRTMLVAVSDGRLTLDQGAGPDRGTRPNYIEIIPTSTPAQFPLALGDFDGNAQVDGADFLQWQRNFGAASASHSQGDGDEDGDVDRADLSVWQASFATTYPASQTASIEFSSPVAITANLLSSEEMADQPRFQLTTLGLPATNTRANLRLSSPRAQRSELPAEAVAKSTDDNPAVEGRLRTDCGRDGHLVDDDAASAHDDALDSLDFDWFQSEFGQIV
jgi:hypothetical protein